MPSVRPPMYIAAATLSTEDGNMESWACAEVTLAWGVGELLVGGRLDFQLLAQIQLSGVHRFGGLLSLPVELVQLRHRVVGRVGMHVCREHSTQHGCPGNDTDYRSLDKALLPMRTVEGQDCVVSVLLGMPETLLADERAALEVLAEAGLAPRLRLVPIHHHTKPGVA